jgi:hypothetical protein
MVELENPQVTSRNTHHNQAAVPALGQALGVSGISSLYPGNARNRLPGAEVAIADRRV